MINAEILTKPFIMLYLNLDLQSLINDDLISEHNYNILSSIGDKIVEIMPSGKISNLYKEKYHNSDRFWNRQSILSNIITYMDYDIKSDLTQFKRDFLRIYHWMKKSLYTLKSSKLLLINYIKII